MVPGDIFQCLVQEDDWDGDLQDHDPLGPAQGGHLEDQLEDRGEIRGYTVNGMMVRTKALPILSHSNIISNKKKPT